MTPDMVAELMRQLLKEAMILAAPLLIAAAVLSFVLSLIQTLTSLQEQSLTSVPRLAAYRSDHAGGNAVVSGTAGGVYAAVVGGFAAVFGIKQLRLLAPSLQPQVAQAGGFGLRRRGE